MGYGYGYGGGWKPYVSVAQRQHQAAKKMAALRKKGVNVQPITIEGRKIAKSFWSEAWCKHIESFSDFSNRLPRGRSYVRNGSVCHLVINKGKVEAKVAGSELYSVDVKINQLPAPKWRAIKARSAGKIGSLLELLQGKLSDEVMRTVTDQEEGLFPHPKEISFNCNCPDWAGMCKHIAAVMYGIAARLDDSPELLFALRGVDHEELIAVDAEAAVTAATSSSRSKHLAESQLSDVFGIDLNASTPIRSKRKASHSTKSKQATKRTPAKKKSGKKKTTAAKQKASHKKSIKKKAAQKKANQEKVTKKKPAKRKPTSSQNVTRAAKAAGKETAKKTSTKKKATATKTTKQAASAASSSTPKRKSAPKKKK